MKKNMEKENTEMADNSLPNQVVQALNQVVDFISRDNKHVESNDKNKRTIEPPKYF